MEWSIRGVAAARPGRAAAGGAWVNVYSTTNKHATHVTDHTHTPHQSLRQMRSTSARYHSHSRASTHQCERLSGGRTLDDRVHGRVVRDDDVHARHTAHRIGGAGERLDALGLERLNAKRQSVSTCAHSTRMKKSRLSVSRMAHTGDRSAGRSQSIERSRGSEAKHAAERTQDQMDANLRFLGRAVPTVHHRAALAEAAHKARAQETGAKHSNRRHRVGKACEC